MISRIVNATEAQGYSMFQPVAWVKTKSVPTSQVHTQRLADSDQGNRRFPLTSSSHGVRYARIFDKESPHAFGPRRLIAG